MVRLKNDKIVIEIKTSAPEELYHDMMKDILVCVQATQADKDNEELRSSLHFLLELYKAMLPDEEQVRMMFAKK